MTFTDIIGTTSKVDLLPSSQASHLTTGTGKLLNLKAGHIPSGPLYPRLASHEGIMIRTNAIADNLDEILMLPQGHLFPLRFNGRKKYLPRIRKAKQKEGAQFQRKPHDQDEYYEEFKDYEY